MELLLNLVWASFSVILIGIWLRRATSTRVSGKLNAHAQILALMLVVLLLLPAISMSDDLMAAQSPAETDSALRRSVDADFGHHAIYPTSFALPEQITADVSITGLTQEAVLTEHVTLPASFHTTALDCRPPPQA